MKYLLIGLFIVLSLSVIVAAARPELVGAIVGPSGKTVVVPEKAVEVAPGVFSLGEAVHEGKVVEGYAIVDYRKEPAKPSGCNNDNKCQGWEDPSCGDCSGGAASSSCYGFLGNGAKWRSAEPYLLNPSNGEGLNETVIADNLALDVAKWEAAANGADIFGAGSITSEALVADTISPDGRNEVYFADVSDSGAIAITIVWGVFRGPPAQRELVEWDQVYDQVDFDWSTSGEAGKMDFENIATHELGHSIGLADLYEGSCSEETMYGYASEGETNKRTLESGDIAGAQKLYK